MVEICGKKKQACGLIRTNIVTVVFPLHLQGVEYEDVFDEAHIDIHRKSQRRIVETVSRGIEGWGLNIRVIWARVKIEQLRSWLRR